MSQLAAIWVRGSPYRCHCSLVFSARSSEPPLVNPFKSYFSVGTVNRAEKICGR